TVSKLRYAPGDHRGKRRLWHAIRGGMDREHTHACAIGEHGSAQVRERRRAIDVGVRHHMKATALAASGRTAGQKGESPWQLRRVGRAQARIFERDCTHEWNSGGGRKSLGQNAQTVAVAAISRD